MTVFLSLGNLPLSDGFLEASQLSEEEGRYPLDVAFCPDCALVQILETVPPEKLFGADYPYFSSFTDTLLRHSEANVRERVTERKLGPQSPSLSSRATTAICCSTTGNAEFPYWVSTPRRALSRSRAARASNPCRRSSERSSRSSSPHKAGERM